jgi:hypothetical protein
MWFEGVTPGGESRAHDDHEARRETPTPERTKRAMQERRKGIRGLISAVVLAAL